MMCFYSTDHLYTLRFTVLDLFTIEDKHAKS